MTSTFFLVKLNAFPLIVRMVPPARLPFLGSTLVISENKVENFDGKSFIIVGETSSFT